MDIIVIKVSPTGAAVILAGLRALRKDPTLSTDEKGFVDGMITEITEGLILDDSQPKTSEEVLH